MSVIAIIDYDVGNIRSIFAAFEKVGANPKLTRDRDEVMSADGLVLPGVGAFSHGMAKLKKYGLDDVIKDFAASNKPVLGVCLGMQILLGQSSEFGKTEGLNLIAGSVTRLQLNDPNVTKLPHVSWNELEVPEHLAWDGTILEDVVAEEDMYFVHSFMAVPDNPEHVLSTTTYSQSRFCSSVRNGNIYGCQFHPEKSGSEGLKIISNFVRMSKVSESD